jgi:hypothetical protein
MPEICGEPHPDHPGVTCVKPRPCYYLHVNYEHQIDWKGVDPPPPPPPRGSRRAEAADLAKGIAPAPITGPPTGEQLKTEGIARVFEGTNPEWAAAFDNCLYRLASTGRQFTSEEVTAQVGLPPAGTHLNAVGARVNAAARAGVITDVGTVKAGRALRHAAKVTLWQGVPVGTPIPDWD